jgi:hypothetical protein
MAAQVKDVAWMEWVASLLGGASRQTYAATFPPDSFYCLLDELPIHLIPRGAWGSLRESPRGPLFLNPDCMICAAGELPEDLVSRRDLIASFAPQGTMAWVRDPGRGSLLPFLLGPRLQSTVRSLRPGQDASAVLPAEDCRVLAAAGILSESRSQQSLPRSLDPAGDLRICFREKGYARFPHLLHPFHVAALRRYYRFLIRRGAIQLGDAQCPRRYFIHNEPVARFFHDQLGRLVSAIAGEPVKPSYVYVASYLSGSVLKKHTDREQCEFSVSLCLDFSPEPEGETPWPLCLDTAEGRLTVHQALGDGLFYRGTQLPHYRDTLAEGLTSTSIFFHYVSTSFDGSLD